MKNKIICIILSVGFIGCLILIIGLFNKKEDIVSDETTTTIELIKIEPNIRTTTRTTKTTKKTTKKVVKTTKKAVVKKVVTSSVSEYQEFAKQYGNYDTTQMNCLINLWNHESGWNPNSVNKKSGACGIPQALPCSKIKKVERSNDWKAQIRWGIKYINYRYKNPCGAWKHFQNKNWY